MNKEMQQKELIKAGYIAMMESLTREAEFEMARITKGLDLLLEPSVSESPANIGEGLTHLCEYCGCELENPDEPCPRCYLERIELGFEIETQ